MEQLEMITFFAGIDILVVELKYKFSIHDNSLLDQLICLFYCRIVHLNVQLNLERPNHMPQNNSTNIHQTTKKQENRWAEKKGENYTLRTTLTHPQQSHQKRERERERERECECVAPNLDISLTHTHAHIALDCIVSDGIGFSPVDLHTADNPGHLSVCVCDVLLHSRHTLVQVSAFISIFHYNSINAI